MKRRDLALMYFPGKEPRAAVNKLLRWISNCPQLMQALGEYDTSFKKKKDLTVRQVRIIMEYLGEP